MKPLNRRNFRPFGKIIEYPNRKSKGDKRNLWRIVHRETTERGWRIAYLVLRDKTIGRLECHPRSDESFEPIKGTALLFVSRKKDLNSIQCFKLNKSIIIHKGIWHGLISLAPETDLKITENLRVTCHYWPLSRRIKDESFLKRPQTYP